LNNIAEKGIEELRVLVAELNTYLSKPEMDKVRWWFRLQDKLMALVQWYADWNEVE